MAPLSIVGTAFTIASISVVCYYVFREPLNFEGKQAIGSLRGFTIFFAYILFAMDALAVVSVNPYYSLNRNKKNSFKKIIPLENDMKSPKHFVGVTGILNRAMCFVIALYVGVGLCGYLKYGCEIKPSITLNLPQNEL